MADDFSYVPTHLLMERGYAGWPKAISQNTEAQEWLIAHCRDALKSRPMSTGELYRALRDKPGFPALGCLLDFNYACIDRAVRAADAREVWILDNEETGGKKPETNKLTHQQRRTAKEYESRLFGGAYSASQLKMAAKDAVIHAIIRDAREAYNLFRKTAGLDPITDWTKPPATRV